MINDFPKEYIEKISDFIKAHEKTLNPGNYDMTKTALEQGYTPKFIMQEIQEITKQAKGIIREAGRYTCSKYKNHRFNSSPLIRFRYLVNTALETLYRTLHVILIENPEKKNEILALLNDEKSRRVMLNTSVNVYNKRIEYRPCCETGIIDDIDIDELLREGREGYDRLTGGDIKDTDKLVLEFATDFVYDSSITLDEKNALILRHVNRTDPRIQKYLSLVCDESLLNKENFKQLYSDTIGRSEWGKMKTSEFWGNYSKIRDYVLSRDISQVSPKYIKLVLTIEYGPERR